MNHIADLQEEERPREKMQRHGARTLTDAELLALLLASGTTERSVLDLAPCWRRPITISRFCRILRSKS